MDNFSSDNLCHSLADFCDTSRFLDDRVRDAFDLKKTFQEVGCLHFELSFFLPLMVL